MSSFPPSKPWRNTFPNKRPVTLLWHPSALHLHGGAMCCLLGRWLRPCHCMPIKPIAPIPALAGSASCQTKPKPMRPPSCGQSIKVVGAMARFLGRCTPGLCCNKPCKRRFHTGHSPMHTMCGSCMKCLPCCGICRPNCATARSGCRWPNCLASSKARPAACSKPWPTLAF